MLYTIPNCILPSRVNDDDDDHNNNNDDQFGVPRESGDEYDVIQQQQELLVHPDDEIEWR